MSGYNLKRIYTKQRYTPILLKQNFSILYERYIMVLNLKRTISAVDSKNIELFSDAYLDETISLLYNSYEDPVNKLIFGEPNKSRFKKELEDLLSDRKNLEFLSDNSFVSLIDNKVVGIVIVGKYLEKPMIFELAVNKQFQGRGIGRQLLVKSILTLQDRYTELLLMVTKGNKKAENLYRSMGFKKIAENLVVLEKGV
ncbi:MAG: GNAT family N-acetyltransferase [Candidatus Thorarchaeota archaeon]